MKSVAIIQNKLGGGGRTRVITSVVQIFNKVGITPDIYTFEGVSKEFIFNRFSKNVNYNLKEYDKFNKNRFGLYKDILLNYIVKKNKEKYDLIFNSNNSLLQLPNDIPVINYIHFPQRASIDKSYNENDLFKKIYQFPIKKLYDRLEYNNSWYFLLNSKYTMNYFNKFHNGNQGNTKVVYPPVEIKEFKNDNVNKNNYITSIGRFGKGSMTTEKFGGQLEILKIAKKEKNLKFKLIGSVSSNKSKKYFNRCKSYKEKYKLDNAQLLPNASFETLKNILKNSKFYLHFRFGEHFGISTVEAIAAGCIPVVPNSGGQKEIVPFENLRFDFFDEIPSIINNLLVKKEESEVIKKQLIKHIDKFSESMFKKNINDIIKNIFDCY